MKPCERNWYGQTLRLRAWGVMPERCGRHPYWCSASMPIASRTSRPEDAAHSMPHRDVDVLVTTVHPYGPGNRASATQRSAA